MEQSVSTSKPAPKQHFIILDGLRGIAAVAVVLLHFGEAAGFEYNRNPISHGFLAVDFFFVLSGFVIGYAYDDRLKNLGIGGFFKARLIRLHPMVVFGSIVGLLAILFNPFNTYPWQHMVVQMLPALLCSVLLMPFPLVPGSKGLFGLNAPFWSLFWEYIANIFYAAFLWRINLRWHAFLLMISGIMICVVCYHYANLTGGWNIHTFWVGATRVSYSFLSGLLIYRRNWIIKNNLGFAGISVLLFAAFIVPYTHWDVLVEPLIVLFYFPFLVALGAGASLRPNARNICIFLGAISYPLYAIHAPLVSIFGNYYNAYKPNNIQLLAIIAGGLVLLIGFAWFVVKIYDKPIRRYLSAGKIGRA